MNDTFYKEDNLSGLKRADFQKTIDGKQTDLLYSPTIKVLK